MKFGITIFILTAFLGISVLGMLTMQMGNGSGHADCMVGVNCSLTVSPFKIISDHFSFFESISTAVFSGIFASFSLLALFLLALALGRVQAGNVRTLRCAPSFAISHALEKCCNSRQKFIHWLLFHENSPSLAY